MGVAEGQYVKSKTSVWWDIKNCHVPKTCDPHTIAQNISSALVKMNYCGPVSISAYGDTTRIPLALQQALNSTGVALYHIPDGLAILQNSFITRLLLSIQPFAPIQNVDRATCTGSKSPVFSYLLRHFPLLIHDYVSQKKPVLRAMKVTLPCVKDASDKRILVDMLFWAVDNPPPANYLLISGDGDFSNALHLLRMRRYNILLAQPQKASALLVAAAKSVWLWTSLSAAGLPLSKVESAQFVNNGYGYLSDSEPLVNESTQATQPVDSFHGSAHMENQKFSNMERGTDLKHKQKQTRTNVTQPSMPRTPNPMVEFEENRDNGNFHQPTYWHPKQFDNQDLTGTYNPKIPSSGSGSTLIPGSPDSSRTNSSYRDGSHQNHNPQSISENGVSVEPALLPVSSPLTNQPRSFVVPHWPDSPKLTSGPPTYVPDIGNLNLSECPKHDCSSPASLPVSSSSTNHPWSFVMPHRPGSPNLTSSPPTYVPDIGSLNLSEHPRHDCSSPASQTQNGGERRQTSIESPNRISFKCSRKGYNAQQKSFKKEVQTWFPDCNQEIPPPLTSSLETATISVDSVLGIPGCPKPSEYIYGLIGVVLLALDTLRNEKIVPTEENMADCIRYGEPTHRDTDVKKALSYALEQQLVVQHQLGTLQWYVGKNDKLWQCVSPMGGNIKQYSKSTWDEIQKFLSSSDGRSAILGTQCRYEAATIMKKMCLKEFSLGEILQILNMVINMKKWIIYDDQSGWKPIKVTVAEINPDSGLPAANISS
ncbi:hypothetical protein DH2020_003122 [Rehmannia glutinosa]|uniref:NYN domain-containing protein n=1 Tax=Rehmannia glutinosa TaxID=99300 RepID=A0ABR0XKQ5_REHGL